VENQNNISLVSTYVQFNFKQLPLILIPALGINSIVLFIVLDIQMEGISQENAPKPNSIWKVLARIGLALTSNIIDYLYVFLMSF